MKGMSTEVMAPRRNKRSEASKAIAKAIIDQYQPSNAEEMDWEINVFEEFVTCNIQSIIISDILVGPKLNELSGQPSRK